MSPVPESIQRSVRDKLAEGAPSPPLAAPLGAPLLPALANATGPADFVVRARSIAKAISSVIEQQHLFANIGGKRYIRVEGWTLTGSLVGVFGVLDWTRPFEGPPDNEWKRTTNSDIFGWEARVQALTLGGRVVGAAEAMCTRAEKNWEKRDDYALRSMAQTRATSKALRQPLGFIIALAGYEATPAEEVPDNAS